MKNNSTGMAHFFKAFGYSIDGLKWIWARETAFRHDVYFCVFCLAGAFVAAGFNPLAVGAVVFSCAFLLVAEVLNSAVECVVDIVSPEFDKYAKAAKDMGSFAVFIAVVNLSWQTLAALFAAIS